MLFCTRLIISLNPTIKIPLIRIMKSKYYDLESILGAMEELWKFSIIQGFEFLQKC